MDKHCELTSIPSQPNFTAVKTEINNMKQLITLFFLSFFLCGVNAQPLHKVVVEEFTGIWCGDCPQGRNGVEHLKSKFGDSVICIGVHSKDCLAGIYSNTLTDSSGVTEFPLAFVDRFSYKPGGGVFQIMGADSSDWDAAVSARLRTPTSVVLHLNPDYDSSTHSFSLGIKAEFTAEEYGPLRFHCLLVEDSVQTDRQQVNYHNNDGSSRWYHKGNPISHYIQRDVMRLNLSDLYGDAIILPEKVGEGSDFERFYCGVIPEGWSDKHLKVVGFISNWGESSHLDTSHFSILNAAVTDLRHTQTPGSEESGKIALEVPFPNPFRLFTSIPVNLPDDLPLRVVIQNSLGQEVRVLQEGYTTRGSHCYYWDGITAKNQLAANGFYLCKITTPQAVLSYSIVLNR
jgi:thiol-disulfide isomerase/thioredoxin